MADTFAGIVVEDAPSGIKSGVASGARVLAVCTSHEREELEGLGAEWIVTDLSKYAPFQTPPPHLSPRSARQAGPES